MNRDANPPDSSADPLGLPAGMGRGGGITDVPGILVGHATAANSPTGCTVILAPAGGAVAGVDVRGAAPGTRETDLLRPGTQVERVHAILLAGGSAFGLAAADGVMAFLAAHDIGHDTGLARVPIVPAAVLFDLALADPADRPDGAMGRRACQAATAGPVAEGNVGVGAGATIGKLLGPRGMMRGGLGTAAVKLDSGATVGALVAVNALGDVYHPVHGRKLAGTRNPNTGALIDTREWLARGIEPSPRPGANTTLAVVATDAALDKTAANRVAAVAHNGLARTIIPVHTMLDGDAVFALSTGDRPGSVGAIGSAAALVLSAAVVRAMAAATGLPGIPAYRDLPHA